ncbi:MAG: hypothetical protein G01um101438_234 [Parcubacteria group bacterium Gr01-1014_38]|nr:MAG: hypothetical protein G01um101438_234 [Parcubacteria group bacterium Gr01-1014_38]
MPPASRSGSAFPPSKGRSAPLGGWTTERDAHRSARPARRRDDPRYVALRLLAIRPRSIRELMRRLSEKGFPPERVQGVIHALQEQRILDDAQFSHILIEQTLARKPVGRKLLAWKLRQASVAPEGIEEALGRVFPRVRELALARAAAAQKLAELLRRRRIAPRSDLKARIGRFLLSRGFSPELVPEVLEEIVFGRASHGPRGVEQ